MTDLADGESIEMQGSGRTPYVLKNIGGVYSCSCPAWRNQSIGIERRTCKHLRKLRGDAQEQDRIGDDLPKTAKPQVEGDSKAPPLLLAHSWDNSLDLAGWHMSEKLDGIRSYWDGKRFVSRLGNQFHAPDWFTAGLPETPLDGELWLGRKAFQRTVSIVRRQDKSDHWREIRYLVFDTPAIAAPFEERLRYLQDLFASQPLEFASAHQHEICRSAEHLEQELARINALGGEGLMLRQPGSRYEAGRSHTLLKVKSFHDAEAMVIEHLPGTGRHKGRLGALLVELPDGTSFSVGTGFSDAQRNSPPPVGSTITFRYQELSDRGVPRFPSFVRVTSTVATAPAKSSNSRSTSAAKQATATVTQSTSTETTNMTRRFEFSEGGSNKFWEATVSGSDVTVRYGRIGTDGQTQTKLFADAATASRHVDKLIGDKTKKGYVETAAV